jgi:glycosyltransferase involved in cell wall biosynthesis
VESTSIRGSLAKGFFPFLLETLKSFRWHLMALGWAWTGGLARQARCRRAQGKSTFEIVTPPVVLPLNRFDSRLLERVNGIVYRYFLWKAILGTRAAGEDAVAFVEQLSWAPAIHPGEFTRLYVDFLDDVSVYAGKSDPERFIGFLKHLAPMSSAAFVTAEKLEPALGSYGYTCPMYRVPNGVDCEWFQRRAEESIVLDDVRRIARPRVGYVGAIYRWVDYGLVNAVANANPDISFVFIGPYDDASRVDQLLRAPNIAWLPAKAYADMPLCIRDFDACLIPFAPGEIAETTNPVKLFEYFALGKPVIATPMAELRQFAELLYIVDSSDSFTQALRAALAENDPAIADRRKAIARKHSWRGHALSMLEVMRAG